MLKGFVPAQGSQAKPACPTDQGKQTAKQWLQKVLMLNFLCQLHQRQQLSCLGCPGCTKRDLGSQHTLLLSVRYPMWGSSCL